MDVFQLVGKEQRSYMKDGQQKFYCGLHLVSMAGQEEGVDGSAVQQISCPSGVDSSRLQLGQWYQLQYRHIKINNQLIAKISGLIPYDVE